MIILKVLRNSFLLLKKSHPLILSSSTAFFATFSLSPTIIILVSILSFFFKKEIISAEMFQILNNTLGEKPAAQIQDIVLNFMALKSSGWITFSGSVFLLFVATTLLKIMQESIHILWHISFKNTYNFKLRILERLKAVGVILFMGFLFIFSLLLDGMVTFTQKYFGTENHFIFSWAFWFLNSFISIMIITIWFSILFKILPDAFVRWKVALRGALLTSCGTYLGKIILGRILLEGTIGNIFGASASFALILLFIFYSSFIMYFGVAFTFCYGELVGSPIIPDKYTDRYEETIITNL